MYELSYSEVTTVHLEFELPFNMIGLNIENKAKCKAKGQN